MRSMSKTQLAKALATMDPGEKVYINAINLSVSAIEELRRMVKTGVVAPVEGEARKAYKDVAAVMSGDVIFPQMTYTRV